VTTQSERPLAGVRVLDLSRVLAGPYCAQMLGDLGADVIKIERPGVGDDTRAWGPPFQKGEAAYFLCANRNKRSLTLDLKSTRGQQILAKLITHSDVVIENFKAGTMDRWGFDREWFELNAARTIHCSITGYGSAGPKAHLPGYDFLAQAESGLMSIAGPIDGEPAKYGVSIVDFCTGQFASVAILAALQSRQTSGLGQKVEANLHSSGIAMLINVATSHLMSGKPARRLGNGHPNAVPYREFICADGRIALPVGNDSQFRNLCLVLGITETADDPDFATMASRVQNRDRIDAKLAAVFLSETVQHWLSQLQAKGVACSSINTVEQALQDPHTLATQMVASVHHPVAGDIRLLGIPFTMSGTPPGIDAPPPALGQHSESILGELLGLDSAEIEALRNGNII